MDLHLVYLLDVAVLALRQVEPLELFEFLLDVLLVEKVQILFVNVGLENLLDIVSFFIRDWDVWVSGRPRSVGCQ